MAQSLEVKRQRGGRDTQAFGKFTRRETLRARLNAKPVDLQTTVLREGG